MPKTAYVISYQNSPNVSFPSAAGMKRYLTSELSVWSDFLDQLGEQTEIRHLTFNNSNIDIKTVSASLNSLISLIGDTAAFNAATRGYPQTTRLPPPSDSVEGQLILGLSNAGQTYRAQSAYFFFLSENFQLKAQSNSLVANMINLGRELLNAAHVSTALPFRQISSQRLSAASRTAENHLKSLEEEISEAQTINAEHEAELAGLRDRIAGKINLFSALVKRREHRREKKHNEWQAKQEQRNKRDISKAELALDQLASSIHQKGVENQQEFDRLKDLFEVQLRLKAPVKLWQERSTQHRTHAQWALWWFIGLSIIAILVGVIVPLVWGDYIAGSFVIEVCQLPERIDCTRDFSAKGPLTIAGLLVVTSLILWVTRLQYKVYLSERHLALDASEKQAFAETFLAMKEGENVGAANEAIVLAALFRPTQDGIIRDDETGMDLSAAAILAKQLGR